MNPKQKLPSARSLLAANVLKLRTGLGISQEKMAEMAGFHRTYVSQIERQAANASLDNVQKLADFLKVPIARLFESPDSN
jgi:transcriptional regulator with XRE-family HTH domain